MIKFQTNNEKNCKEVFASVDFGSQKPSDECMFQFRFVCNDSHYAYLLARHFQEQLEQAHRDAYNQGFRDGRQHKRKKTNFVSFFGDNEPAW